MTTTFCSNIEITIFRLMSGIQASKSILHFFDVDKTLRIPFAKRADVAKIVAILEDHPGEYAIYGSYWGAVIDCAGNEDCYFHLKMAL